MRNTAVIQQSEAYSTFVNSLRSQQTKDVYICCLNDFLKYLDKTCEKLLELEPKQVQQKIINYVVDMRDNRKLSPNTISCRVSALQTFFQMNDIEGINWFKVKKYKGEFYTVSEDRPYTRQEIHTLVENAPALRDKAIILLLSSSGMRVGGLVKIQLKHVKAIDKYNIYQFEVYKKSREAYITFCTPETRNVIDQYLEWRKRLGEKLTPNSPLFRKEFETKFGARAPPKLMTEAGVSNMVLKIRFRTGIVQVQHLTENHKNGQIRSHIMTVHGLRKYLDTTATSNGMDTLYVEHIMGHDIGLKHSYYKPKVQEILEGNDKMHGYISIINDLTINEENRLKTQVSHLREELLGVSDMRRQIEAIEKQLGIKL